MVLCTVGSGMGRGGGGKFHSLYFFHLILLGLFHEEHLDDLLVES